MFASKIKALRNKSFLKILSLVAVLSFYNCAKIGSPTGGPRDEDPPVVVASKPPNKTTHFNSKRIEIEFDEFIKLDKVNEEFTVSPPLEKKPYPFLKGKSVEVELNLEELDSVTYTLNFGNSIKDNNEGNVLENFEFTFSLLDYIDSLSVQGQVLNAFDLQADEDRLFVCLQDTVDSLPYTVEPIYISRTNAKGKFQINHVAPGTYFLYALKDDNNNLLFDLEDEIVAFASDPVYLYPDSFALAPAIVDSVQNVGDTEFSDSVLIAGNWTSLDSLSVTDSLPDSLITYVTRYIYDQDMFFFQEKIWNQFIETSDRASEERLEFYFAEEIEDSVVVKPLDTEHDSLWYVLESSAKMDSLVFWMVDSSLINNDTLNIEIGYLGVDSLRNETWMIDTIPMRYKKKEERSRAGRGNLLGLRRPDVDTVTKEPRLVLRSNAQKGSFDLNTSVRLIADFPIDTIYKDSILFRKMVDTVWVDVDFNIESLKRLPRHLSLNAEMEEATKYELMLPQGCIKDVYGKINDSTTYAFQTQPLNYYGILYLKLEGIDGPTIIQLLDEKENIVRQMHVDEDGELAFEYLHPKTYILKAIIDRNGNGKWDTGNFHTKLQPEEVIYQSNKVPVRSNWEQELPWRLHEHEEGYQHETADEDEHGDDTE